MDIFTEIINFYFLQGNESHQQIVTGHITIIHVEHHHLVQSHHLASQEYIRPI